MLIKEMNFELVGFFIGVIAIVIRIATVERLRAKHLDIWIRLGRPMNIDQGSSDYPSVLFDKFIFRGEFLRVDDSVLKILGILFVLLVAICVLLLVLLTFGVLR